MDWDQVRRDLINASAGIAEATADKAIKFAWGEASLAIGYAAEGFGIPRDAVTKLTDAVDLTLRKAAGEGIQWVAAGLGGGPAPVEVSPVADTPEGGGSTALSLLDSDNPFVSAGLEAALGTQQLKDYRELRGRLSTTVRLPDTVAAHLNVVCTAIDDADAEEAKNAGQGFDETFGGGAADPFGGNGGPSDFEDIERSAPPGGLGAGSCVDIGAIRALRADTRALARTLGLTESQAVRFLRAHSKMTLAVGQLEAVYDAEGDFLLEE